VFGGRGFSPTHTHTHLQPLCVSLLPTGSAISEVLSRDLRIEEAARAALELSVGETAAETVRVSQREAAAAADRRAMLMQLRRLQGNVS